MVLSSSVLFARAFYKQRDKFLDEAKRLAKFRNTPAVVSVLDFFKDNGTAYLVMTYINGILPCWHNFWEKTL